MTPGWGAFGFPAPNHFPDGALRAAKLACDFCRAAAACCVGCDEDALGFG